MMEKPCLIVVTGMPGAGKTTFSRALGEALFLPVISRDQIKEGYVHTFGRRHSELPPGANAEATGIFFETLRLLTGRGVSVVCEAAFQHPLWERELAWFMDKARVYLLICTVDRETASKRFVGRGLQNPKREYFHGDRASSWPGRAKRCSSRPTRSRVFRCRPSMWTPAGLQPADGGDSRFPGAFD